MPQKKIISSETDEKYLLSVIGKIFYSKNPLVIISHDRSYSNLINKNDDVT
jgi:hypothetical protein